MNALTAATIADSVCCSAALRMNRSPSWAWGGIGGKPGGNWGFGSQLMMGGYAPAFICSTITAETSAGDPAQFGCTNTVRFAFGASTAASRLALKSASVSSALAGKNRGAFGTSTTPTSTPPRTVGSAANVSTAAPMYLVMVSGGMIPGDAPGTVVNTPTVAGANTSLLPIQRLTKVGSASRARPICVLPPRMNVCNGLFSPVGVGGVREMSHANASGTATSLIGPV